MPQVSPDDILEIAHVLRSIGPHFNAVLLLHIAQV